MPSGSSVRQRDESDGGEPPSEVTDASPMDTGKSRDCSRVVCLVVAVSDWQCFHSKERGLIYYEDHA